jgi:thymidine kinase/SAM-dependent methyltransferase
MSILLFTGPTGSGKSQRLIARLNDASRAGRAVQTFICRDYPWPQSNTAYWQRRQLVSRARDEEHAIDHFVSLDDMAELLQTVPPGSTVGIDEAFAFGIGLADAVSSASGRGVEMLIAHPSAEQAAALLERGAREEALRVSCTRCRAADGTETVLDAGGTSTMTLCPGCYAKVRDEAIRTITTTLRDVHPDPGRPSLYQPIELPGLENWSLARSDTPARIEVIMAMLDDLGVLDRLELGERLSYLDIGCCTGSLCHAMSLAGFSAKGVDAVTEYVSVARLMDSFVRRHVRPGREFVLYEREGALEYLTATVDERFDVISALAVFQWVVIQDGLDAGIQAIRLAAQKAKRAFILEMPYSDERHYAETLPRQIDRRWTLALMRESFPDVRFVSAGTAGIKRDLFLGVV